MLALWIGPRDPRLAERHDLRTVGDFLELRYSSNVRAVVSLLLWIGSLSILAGQLIAIAWILNVVTGAAEVPPGASSAASSSPSTSRPAGCSPRAWVNMVQLTVKLVGFAIALPLALRGGRRLERRARGAGRTTRPTGTRGTAARRAGCTWRCSGRRSSISPGLLQKIYGARDDRAVRLGVGAQRPRTAALRADPAADGHDRAGPVPVARVEPELALPMILMYGVPPIVGSLGLAAVFSAEISAADAVLFMLTTSLSQDLYKRFLNPAADDRRMLAVTRLAAVGCGAIGVALAIVSPTVIGVLSIFYTLLGVSLFVPIIAGLYSRRAATPEALASIGCGVAAMLAVQLATGGARLRLD